MMQLEYFDGNKIYRGPEIGKVGYKKWACSGLVVLPKCRNLYCVLMEWPP